MYDRDVVFCGQQSNSFYVLEKLENSMRKYFIILILVLNVGITNCRAGNTGGCAYGCNERAMDCIFFGIMISDDPITNKVNRSQSDTLIFACNTMGNQCVKSCEKKEGLLE
jgi:hypothetical protein